jgi:hypothetical protein
MYQFAKICKRALHTYVSVAEIINLSPVATTPAAINGLCRTGDETVATIPLTSLPTHLKANNKHEVKINFMVVKKPNGISQNMKKTSCL